MLPLLWFACGLCVCFQAPLLDLAQFTSVQKWRKGEVIMTEQHGTKVDPVRGGLYFIVQV